MNRLQLAVSVAPAIVLIVFGFKKAKHMYREFQDQRIKQHQIATRVNRDNDKKVAAVQSLETRLKSALLDVNNHLIGYPALRAASIKVESVYHEWLCEYYGLFLPTDASVRISGIHNGFFQYELPSELKQFTKGNRK